MKIGRAVLTTENPASSYGMPVLVLDGVAYGPDDIVSGHPMGAHIICSDAVCRGQLSQQTIDQLCRWLKQSPINGERWIASVRQSNASHESEFPDER